MKINGITSTAIVSLLLGIAIPVYSRQEQQNEKQDHPGQQQSKPEQETKPEPQHVQEQQQRNQNQQHAEQQQQQNQNKQQQQAEQRQQQDQNIDLLEKFCDRERAGQAKLLGLKLHRMAL